MITLAWVNQQIEEALNGDNKPQNVRDFALLCIARDNLQSMSAASAGKPERASKQDAAVMLTAHSADLDTVPTIQQIGEALMTVSCHSCEERERIKDMRTWADIIAQNS